MASITRCLRNVNFGRSILALGVLLCSWAAAAQGIHVKSAQLDPNSGEYYLNANFEVDLTPTLEEALNRGVVLHFIFEFDLILPRWYTLYLWNKRVVEYEQHYRLTYNALTRQYRLSLGALHQGFDTLEEALAVLGRLPRRSVFAIDDIAQGVVYEAQVRMRLDTAQLPKPFQVDALASRDWNLSSGWYRWTLTR